MAGFSLRRYDTQAFVGLIISLLSAVALLGLFAVVFSLDKGFGNLRDLVIYYGPNRRLAVFAGGAATALLALAGLGLGLSSVGQRRNDKPLYSWISFFVGGIVLCLAVVLLFFFYRQGEPATIS